MLASLLHLTSLVWFGFGFASSLCSSPESLPGVACSVPTLRVGPKMDESRSDIYRDVQVALKFKRIYIIASMRT